MTKPERMDGLQPTPDISDAPDWLFIAKIVMFLHQAVEQRLLRGAPHLLELERLQSAHASSIGVLSISTGSGRPLCQRIMPHVTDRRKRDLAGSLQHQQHAAAHHVTANAPFA